MKPIKFYTKKIYIFNEKKPLPEIKQSELRKWLVTPHFFIDDKKHETKYRHICFKFSLDMYEKHNYKITDIMEKDWRHLDSEAQYKLSDAFYCEYVFDVIMSSNGCKEQCELHKNTWRVLKEKLNALNALNISFQMGEHWFWDAPGKSYQIALKK